MARTLAHSLVILQLCWFPTSCASAPRHAYDQVTLNLPLVGRESVALLVVDQRQPVVSGNYTGDFVGTYQSQAGAGEPMRTRSGEPFAHDVAVVLRRALERSGYQVNTLEAEPGLAREHAFQQLRAAPQKHLVLLEIREWQVKTFQNTQIDYRLALSVFNAPGALKGQADVKGSDQLDPNHEDSERELAEAAERALGHKLGMLFAEPKVAAAFRRDH